MTNSSARFDEHISAAPNWWRQMVYLCIEIKAWDVEKDPGYFGDFFAAAPAKTILAETLRDVPEGLLTALKKLAAFPLPSGGYVQLLALLNETASNQVLRHEQEITWWTIDVLRRLPAELRCTGMLNTLTSPEEADALHYVLAVLKRYLTDVQINRFYQATTRIRRQDQLGEFLVSWLMKAPFPTPPWEGTETLRPVSSVAVLNDIRRSYQNCLKDYILSVLRGEAYFYEWTGNQQVIVQLEYDPIIGWMIDHMEGGVSSREVSEPIRQEVLDAFSAVGINPRPNFQSILRLVDTGPRVFA
jgi:hypothetical protein